MMLPVGVVGGRVVTNVGAKEIGDMKVNSVEINMMQVFVIKKGSCGGRVGSHTY